MARAHPKPDHVRVRVLGATDITVGSRRVGMSTEALFALALFVTTRAGERLTRAEVLETFWPGSEEEARRHALRQMLYRLRQKGFRFAEEGEHLCLEAELVDSDVRACTSASWPESASAEAVEAALTLGPTFSARLPSTFLEWFEGVRAAVSHQARKAAFRWIATSRMQGRWAELERWSRAVLRVDPLNEEATLALAEAASMLGSKTLALEILDGYLAEVSGPDASVGKPAQILRKRIAERRASWLPSGPREVALIGRAEEMSVLTQAIEASLGGQSRSVLLVGPSGYGKSRLLAEAREYAALRGVRCVGVRADTSVAAHPWALARDLCRELIGQPGAAATDPRSMAVLRALMREDGTADAGIGFSAITTDHEIRRALVAVAVAIADEARTLITVDDLQNADESSRTVLRSVMQDLENSRCSCLAATQPGTQTRSSASAGRLGVQSLRLAALTTADAKHLAHLTARGHGSELSEDALERIAERSGGHPLFARELALSYLRVGERGPIPATLADVVARNLAAQPPEAMQVLRIVALLANTATISRVQAISAQERGAFLSCIEALSADGVLHLDHQRVLRLHDSWRDAVLHSMPEALSGALALECATALSRDSDLGVPSTHGRLADLYKHSGETGKSIDHRLKSIDSLRTAGLYDAAVDEIRKEESTNAGIAVHARFQVREAACLLAMGQPRQSQPLADAVWRSRELQSAKWISEHLLAVCVASDAHIMTDAADRAPIDELHALAVSGLLSPQDVARACLWGIRTTSNIARTDAMARFSMVPQLRDGSLQHIPAAAVAELIFAAEEGTAGALEDAYNRFRLIDQADLSLTDRCMLLRCAAQSLRISGKTDEAVLTAETAFGIAKQHDLNFAARMASELLCHILLDENRTGEAAHWLQLASGDTDGPATASTLTAATHARDRLEFQCGEVDGISARIAERLTVIEGIGQTIGRASELALASAVLSRDGKVSEAEQVAIRALSVAHHFLGRYSADIVIDYCLQAAGKTAFRERVETIARSHIDKRTRVRGLRIAPSFRELLSVQDRLS